MDKICLKCNFKKLTEEFEKHSGAKDGLQTRCRSCKREDRRDSYKRNSAVTNIRTALYYEKNKEQILIKKQEYYRDHKEAMKSWQAAYSKENKNAYRNYKAKYRAAKLKATPSWADQEKIKQFYLNCPKGFHVDHIIPLQGKNICGLHIETNLQYLSASDNCRKGNKYG